MLTHFKRKKHHDSKDWKSSEKGSWIFFDAIYKYGISFSFFPIIFQSFSTCLEALYCFRSFGEVKLVEMLESALEFQWLHGCFHSNWSGPMNRVLFSLFRLPDF